MASSRYTPYNTFLTRVTTTLNNYAAGGIDATHVSSLETYINQAIELLCEKYKLLRDIDFTYNTTTGTLIYEVSGTEPYPYAMDNVWYKNSSGTIVEITRADYSVIQADIGNSNTTVSRYAIVKQGGDTYIKLNANPGTVTAGITLRGPYRHVYVTTGGTMPLEKHWDYVIERMVLAMATENLGGTMEERVFESKLVQEALSRMGIG